MRALLLPALLALPLAACGRQEVRAPGEYPLSGTISGDWGSAPRLRLALVGTGFPVAVTTNSAVAQNVVSAGTNTWNYGFDLPNLPGVAGVYQVVVFDDANNDAALTLGEPVARNRRWLVFSPLSGTLPAVSIPEFLPGDGGELLPEMTVSRGWNLYDRAQSMGAANPRAVTKITGYDLSR